jgi:nicotinamidase-related amidase
MDRLDPARTALVLVHMVKGVAGDVDTPFSRLFRQRAEEAGLLGTQQRLLDRFRAAGAMVVRGQGASGFEGTSLDTILRVAGVANLVLAGIATDVAVESTARAACDLAYRPIVVSDGCLSDTAQGHANSLAVIKKWFGETPTADEVLSALK